ncbi:unnamed protein product [marine sediment metagenome]|uniref:Uncharacterized protein n=1 Tax=marine sediment metagenome TaxID=412755 RepID=X0Z8J0_9ZZZZ
MNNEKMVLDESEKGLTKTIIFFIVVMIIFTIFANLAPQLKIALDNMSNINLPLAPDGVGAG